MTKQEIFETVANHLLKQNKKSFAWNGCKYRGPNETKCAVGVLITDEEYDYRMEGLTVDNLKNAKLLPFRLIQHTDLLVDLQHIHDCFTPRDWRRKLVRIGGLHDLNTDFLTIS